jgi:hypothetical protein
MPVEQGLQDLLRRRLFLVQADRAPAVAQDLCAGTGKQVSSGHSEMGHEAIGR